MPLTEKELFERDAKRNVGEELLTAIKSIKAGRYGRQHSIKIIRTVTASGKSHAFKNQVPD